MDSAVVEPSPPRRQDEISRDATRDGIPSGEISVILFASSCVSCGKAPASFEPQESQEDANSEQACPVCRGSAPVGSRRDNHTAAPGKNGSDPRRRACHALVRSGGALVCWNCQFHGTHPIAPPRSSSPLQDRRLLAPLPASQRSQNVADQSLSASPVPLARTR
jgi:hypothetical protein